VVSENPTRLSGLFGYPTASLVPNPEVLKGDGLNHLSKTLQGISKALETFNGPQAASRNYHHELFHALFG
jgi:hypothetical protein